VPEASTRQPLAASAIPQPFRAHIGRPIWPHSLPSCFSFYNSDPWLIPGEPPRGAIIPSASMRLLSECTIRVRTEPSGTSTGDLRRHAKKCLRLWELLHRQLPAELCLVSLEHAWNFQDSLPPFGRLARIAFANPRVDELVDCWTPFFTFHLAARPDRRDGCGRPTGRHGKWFVAVLQHFAQWWDRFATV